MFTVQLKNYKRVFEHILEMEKKVDQANKNLVSYCHGNYIVFIYCSPQNNCEDKEKKLHKELLKGTKVGIV